MTGRITIVGGGSGTDKYMLPIAKSEIEKSDFLIAGQRFLTFLNHPNYYKFGKLSETLELVKELIKKGNVAIVVSGDPLMYSFYKTIQNSISDVQINIIPAVGSLQLLGAKFGETMEHARIISVHGRDIKDATIAMTVYENSSTFFLCSKEHDPAYICQILINYSLENVEVCVGANLSYDDELTDMGTPFEIVKKQYPTLCTVLIKNPTPQVCSKKALLSDSDFLRNKTPMTKEEVRAIILLKLHLQPDSIVWDLGAGTGSISVEVARQCQFGKVYAVEKNNNAIEVLKKNKEKFDCENMYIVEDNSLNAIKTLPVPDTIFIGGSSGELKEIIQYILKLTKNIRIVISAVTLETKNIAYEIMKELSNFEITDVSISRGKKIGSYTIMDNNNIVTVISADTK